MATLNPDILEEILPHLSDISPVTAETKRNNAEALHRFMSTGKEPFNAALRYFSHVICVFNGPTGFLLLVRRFPLKNGEIYNRHSIPYDFEYLDAILMAFPETLEIHVNEYPKCVAGKRALAILIHNKRFESLRLYCHDLPPEYIKFFKEEFEFDLLAFGILNNSSNFVGNNPSYLDILEMSANHHRIRATLLIFLQETHKLPLGQTFPLINDLTLVCEESNQRFLYTVNKIKQFLLILPDRFPNLLAVDASFKEDNNEIYIEWDDVYEEMVKMQPHQFRDLVSPDMEGSLSFYVSCYAEQFDDIADGIEETDYRKVVKKADGTGSIVTKFEIHDGLTFKFKLYIHGGN